MSAPSPLDPLEALDLAAFCFTRVAAFDHASGAGDSEDFERWIAHNDPAWRRRLRSAEATLEAAAAIAGERPIGAVALAEAAKLLGREPSGWSLPSAWSARTLVLARLPVLLLQSAAASAKCLDAGDVATVKVDETIRRRMEATPVIDAHVHIGAIVSFDTLFGELLRTSVVAPEMSVALNQRTFADSEGQAFDIAMVAIAVAVLASLLNEYVRCPAGAGTDFAAFVERHVEADMALAIREGSVWQYAGSQDESGFALFRSPRLRAMCIDGTSTRPLYTAADVTSWLNACGGDVDLALAQTVDLVLRGAGLVFAAMTQGARSGLGEFLIASRGQSRLRRHALMTKQDVTLRGLRALTRRGTLAGIELRTAEQSASGEPALTASELASRFDQIFRAVSSHQSAVGPLRTSVPVCLLKTPELNRSHLPTGTDGETLSARFDLRPLWDVMGALVCLVGSSSSARVLIPGLDVAGDECAGPNWAYGAVFAEYLSRLASEPIASNPPAVSLRVHAGESYRTRLEGLRHVHEALKIIPPGTIPRIGHGLVLGDIGSPGAWCSGMAQPRDAAFDDIVWAWAQLRGGTEGGREVASHLELAIERVGCELYGEPGCTASQYLAAYEARFDIASLRAVGLLGSSVEREHHLAYIGRVRLDHDLVELRLLATYLTNPELGHGLEDGIIEPIWRESAFDELRTQVIDEARKRGAVIEACPTSNLIIAGIEGYAAHPLFRLRQEGLAVTINTDDPGLFATDIADEYGAVWAAADQAEPELRPRADWMMEFAKVADDVFDGPSLAELQRCIDAARDDWVAAGLLRDSVIPVA